MLKDYDAMTKDFLVLFTTEWHRSLEKIGCTQKQLVVGSRLRPQIVLWGYLAGVDMRKELELDIPVYAAVSVELIHKASLLLDDWIDNDDERHGEHAFHIDYGEHLAVMTAMKMVAALFSNLLHSSSENTTKIILIEFLVRTATAMTDGVISELSLNDETMFDLNLIKQIAQMETSEIIGNSLLMGYALSGQANDTLIPYLKKIGDLSGYLFQTLNDLESFSNVHLNKQHKGKENFDVNRNRKNIIVAYLHALLTKKELIKIASADIGYIASLYEKYHIERLVMREMELVFHEIENLIRAMGENGVSEEWVNGYTWFIHLLQRVALLRVSKD